VISIIRRWRDRGYDNIYGTVTIQDWCAKFGLQNTSTIRVLDIGCGNGRDLVAIRNKLPAQPVELFGIECTDDLARQAAQHGVQTYRVDLESESLPFPNNYFDIVISNQVLEHLKNSIWAFHEQVRVTKRNGLMIIGVPNLAALHNRVLVTLGRQPSCMKADGPHVRGFTLHELLRLVSASKGIQPVGRGGTYIYGFPPAIGKLLGRLFPSLSTTILVAIKKTTDQADILSLLGEGARFETNYFVG